MIILLGHLLNSMDEEVAYHLSSNPGHEILYYFSRTLIAVILIGSAIINSTQGTSCLCFGSADF